MRRVSTLSLALSVWVTAAVCDPMIAVAQEGLPPLFGQVLRLEGEGRVPQSDVLVELLAPASETVLHGTYSGPEGKYAFRDVKPATYELRVSFGHQIVLLAATPRLITLEAKPARLNITFSRPLRTKPAQLSREDVERMIRERGLHHPSEGILGTFRAVFQRRTLPWGVEVVFDRTTGLVWQHSGSFPDTMSWQEAHNYIYELNRNGLGGFTDWRLPTVEELVSLLQPPARDERDTDLAPEFEKGLTQCWTADSLADDPKKRAWEVEFKRNGSNVDDEVKTDKDYALAVRSKRPNDRVQ